MAAVHNRVSQSHHHIGGMERGHCRKYIGIPSVNGVEDGASQPVSYTHLGIPCHLIERFLVYLRYFIEISQLGLGFKYPSVVIQYGICTFFM